MFDDENKDEASVGKKDFSKLEIFLLVLAVVIFVSLTLVLYYRGDWFYSLFGLENDTSKEELILEDLDSIEGDIGDKENVYLDIDSSDGEAVFFINLPGSYDIAALEILLEHPSNLEIEEFECEQPFECMNVKKLDKEVYIVALIPVTFEEELANEQRLGQMQYSGSGEVSIDIEKSEVVLLGGEELLFFEPEEYNF